MAFGKISEVSGNTYFKHAEHANALGLLLEPKRFNGEAKNPFFGKDPNATETRVELIADISVFDNQAALNSGKPSSILKNAIVTAKYLARDGGKMLDNGVGAAAVKVGRTSLTNGAKPYVWEDAPADIATVIEGYYEAREGAAAAFDDSDFE